ncbi:M23 family metallopeptidase [Desulfoluna sp.]|uniref:M23 family metallopeptidase n=1 Tax=Desulfoluna sp. TaxID=2045199 RepID=UPI00260E7373|nr:M23 family metallopeptidase [Desulfoluna sp.]
MFSRRPSGHFIKAISQANGLGPVRFVAHEAMLFGTRKSWWGGRKARPLPHEGVDLCRYYTQGGEPRSLSPGARIPVACEGRVWAVTDDDFIGRSIYVRHEGCQGVFFTVYAHVSPRTGLAEGDALVRGEVLATLADPVVRHLRISPHLHFSLMTFPDSLSRHALRWATMGAGNEVCFHDPRSLLGEDMALCEEAADSALWCCLGPVPDIS